MPLSNPPPPPPPLNITLNERKSEMVDVITRHYEFAHGRRPRGYGSWAFSFTGPNPDVLDPTQLFWVHASKYGAAKKVAVALARKCGQTRVWVLT
jgi:hypothetical protein